jgi:hypothetical protein
MSSEHNFYTNQIVLWTQKYFDHPGLDIADDTQDNKTSNCRPQKVYASVDGELRSCLPDFSATNIFLKPKLYILGEAKTADDFEKRSNDADNQMNVMINHLKKQSKSILIYSVPNELVKNVKNKLRHKIIQYDAENIQIEVIDQFFK